MPPPHDLQSAQVLVDEFEGRITTHHEAHAEFVSQPTVLVPKTNKDVERALQLARAAGKRVFVRSGRRVSSTHVSRADGVVVSMESFAHVERQPDGTIKAGPAATLQSLADGLADDQFLPLGDNPGRSLASALLTDGGSPFPRSAPGLSLRDGLAGADVVETDDVPQPHTMLAAEGFARLHAGTERKVMTNVTLDASKWAEAGEQRWAHALVCPYEPTSFRLLCDSLFGGSEDVVNSEVDLSVRVTSATLGMRLVVVRATGRTRELRENTTSTLDSALETSGSHVVLVPTGGPEEEWAEDSPHSASAGSVEGAKGSVRLWLSTGPGEPREDEVLTRFGSTHAQRFADSFRQDFLAAVELAIGVDDEGHEHAPGVAAWAELRLAPDGGVDARAHVAESEAGASAFNQVCAGLAVAMPAFDASEAALRSSPGRAALRGRDVLTTVQPVAGFRLPEFKLAVSSGSPIPDLEGFRGQIERRGDRTQPMSLAYAQANRQYANEEPSYDPQVIAARMSPRLIATPLDVADVLCAVKFAAKHTPKPLAVVARSGGHQYCGLSSGGDDTLLLDMQNFTGMSFEPTTGTPTQVKLQPGVNLEKLSAALHTRRVLIPHGECPKVNIGGHVQTGGVGHQLRSFGLALDHVLSFKMVTAVPHSTQPVLYAERTFYPPTSSADQDGQVFRAVLGGGPGSWGVLTELTFKLVSDSAAPAPYGRTVAYPYTRDAFAAAMRCFRHWVERLNNPLDPLPDGVDLFLTVFSGDVGQLRPPVLVVESMAKSQQHRQEIDAVFNEVRAARPLLLRWLRLRNLRETESVAAIAHAGTRKRGCFGMRRSGREFDLPYRKSLYLTHVPFSQTFCEGFVKLVHKVYRQKGVKVVFQSVVGGGEAARLGQHTTYMQRRSALAQFVFDVFYEGPTYEPLASDLQAEMKALLPEFSDNADCRMFWGTFEDEGMPQQLRMADEDTQRLYFDTPDPTYRNLQVVKGYTDPQNVFRTSFTIQPRVAP